MTRSKKSSKADLSPQERAQRNREIAREFKEGRADAKDDLERGQTPYHHWLKNHPK